MRLNGVDSDDESFDERSDYTQSRRLAEYDLRGEATAEEMAWLHEHPLLWFRALKAIRAYIQHHIDRANIDLAADPRKPTGNATAEIHRVWAEVKAESLRLHTKRMTFLNAVKERAATVRELLPHDVLQMTTVSVLLSRLLDIDMRLESGEIRQARIALANIILKLEKDSRSLS